MRMLGSEGGTGSGLCAFVRLLIKASSWKGHLLRVLALPVNQLVSGDLVLLSRLRRGDPGE